MEHAGIVPAEGCPHFITEERLASWRRLYGVKPSRCGGCNKDGFVPSQRLRMTTRRSYDVERVGNKN